MVRVLNPIAAERWTNEIVIDNTPEFRGRELGRGATQKGCASYSCSPASRHKTLSSSRSTRRSETRVSTPTEPLSLVVQPTKEAM